MFISKFGGTDILNRIDEYEDLIGKKLPVQFRKFLNNYNGGETPNTSFKCNGISSDLKGFYGLGEVKYPLKRENVFESNGIFYLLVALDSFGNEILLDLQSGSVFFRDHENEGIKRLADTLCDFICACESKPINPSSVKSVEEREKDLINKGRGHIITEALRNMWRAEIKKYSSIVTEEVKL